LSNSPSGGPVPANDHGQCCVRSAVRLSYRLNLAGPRPHPTRIGSLCPNRSKRVRTTILWRIHHQPRSRHCARVGGCC